MTNWGGKTILVAEDDLLNFKLLKYMLSDTGVNILWAKNGEEAIAKTKNNKIDAILMDIEMPVMDGREASLKIRESNDKVPIIILSAHDYSEIRSITSSKNIITSLRKPIRIQELYDTIGKYFNSAIA